MREDTNTMIWPLLQARSAQWFALAVKPRAGQRVRIKGGALAGVEGVVIGFRQSLRLILSITLLQRSVLLEIDRRLVCIEELSGWRDGRPWSASCATSLDVLQGD
uniref:KOW domain-containing protein n=1 Tax=Solibacter usitatus (strain Ellin6076) TaxID=234267 RepID=Q01WX6_SOLUE